ncbi:MAG: hypothetical protein EP329_23660 [Deltaproteobacteria bacterium]|nr:MAG: hypothetical protein EP329_23660 [Deltaproteobacteria bacterium]
MRPARTLLVALVTLSSAALVACGDSASTTPTDTAATSDADTSEDTAAAPVTGLMCPDPGALPFTVEATALDTEAGRYEVENDPRVKDSGADYLGVPGGVGAITTQALAATLLDGSEQPVVGRMARSPMQLGLEGSPIPGEWVSTWRVDDAGVWSQVGRARTDDNGQYAFALAGEARFGLGSHWVYGVLEAAGTCVEHGYYLWPAGTKVIVTDIDGTLTLDDTELAQEIADGTYVPQAYTAADALVRAWHDKGYQVVYMTARPHPFRAETRAWLARFDYPTGPIITADALVLGADAVAYKSAWLAWLKDDLGWDIVAVYGNADSDITAYDAVGIPKDRTFIIGPEAGADGTTAIAGDDYTPHIESFVAAQPEVDPGF